MAFKRRVRASDEEVKPRFTIQGTEMSRIRISLRMTQGQYADMFGVARQTVSDWERGADKIPTIYAKLTMVLADDPRLMMDGYPRLLKLLAPDFEPLPWFHPSSGDDKENDVLAPND